MFMDMPQPEPRVQIFESIIGALKVLLESCGRPAFLRAAFNTWAGMTNSLCVMERMHFPDLPPETSTSLTLPPRAQPLNALLEPHAHPYHGRFGPAIGALNEFMEWFKIQYNIEPHQETWEMLQDTMLILQSCKCLIELAPAPVTEAPTPAALPHTTRRTAPPADPSAPCMVLLPNEY